MAIIVFLGLAENVKENSIRLFSGGEFIARRPVGFPDRACKHNDT
jgi:hypothetical protein